MRRSDLVYDAGGLTVGEVVAAAGLSPVRLGLHEVEVEQAGKSVAGEVWSPQLLPFRPWGRTGADAGASVGAGSAAQDGEVAVRSDEAAAAGFSPDYEGVSAPGTDGDLLVVGVRGMGISDEERERLVAKALLDTDVGGAAAVAVPLRGAGAESRPPVAVRREEEGYALVGFDLRRLADEAGDVSGLAVVLPSFVDGVPVVRIAAEAFARRYVQGVGVRVLVVPDTVRRIGSGAFAALPGQHIHLGAGVCTGGAQPCDLASVSPRLERRTYSASPQNEQYRAHEGSLFSRDGAHALFLAPPYGREVALPCEVRFVGEAAFCAGCEPPQAVRAGTDLERVASKAWDKAVWLLPDGAPARRALRKRGVRLARPGAVEHDGCWYDFEGEGAVLVAGPPAPPSASVRFAASAAALRRAHVADSAHRLSEEDARARAEANSAHGQMSGGVLAPVTSGPAAAAVQATRETHDVLELPCEVEGRPLVKIGRGALPFAPATLIIPRTVRVVEDDNACKGAKRLMLPEGLRVIGERCFCSRAFEAPVLVPASVERIGWGSFEYAVCRIEGTEDAIHVSSDQALSCFVEEGEAQGADGVAAVSGASAPGAAQGSQLIDFARYDDVLVRGRGVPDRLGAVLQRIAAPHDLSPSARDELVSWLRREGRGAWQRVAREGDVRMVAALANAGLVEEGSFSWQIELLRSCNRMDCVAFLMEWRRDRCAGAGGEGGEGKPRFSLSGELGEGVSSPTVEDSPLGSPDASSVEQGKRARKSGSSRGGLSSRERFAL